MRAARGVGQHRRYAWNGAHGPHPGIPIEVLAQIALRVQYEADRVANRRQAHCAEKYRIGFLARPQRLLGEGDAGIRIALRATGSMADCSKGPDLDQLLLSLLFTIK